MGEPPLGKNAFDQRFAEERFEDVVEPRIWGLSRNTFFR